MVLDMSKFGGVAFIKLEDLSDEPLTKTILGIEESQFARPVLTFTDGKRLSLNKTNVNALLKVFGDSSADWIGKRIEVYAGIVKYAGAENAGIRVRAVGLTNDVKTESHADMDQEIPF